MQLWPAWLNPATLIFAAAVFQSPSGSMMHRCVVAQLEPDPLARRPGTDGPADLGRAGEGDQRDVGVVDEGVADRAAAAGDDVQVARPADRTRRSSICGQARCELNGVWLAGLSTTGQPAAMAGATLWATRLSGKLNGAIAPTTPMGTRSVKPELALAGRDGVERDHLAGQLARLGGGELERADGALGLDPSGLDRLGRLAWR